MPSLLAAVVFPDVDGIVADEVVNTFAFSTEDADNAAAIAGLEPFVQAFYNAPGSHQPLAYYLNTSRDRTGDKAMTKWYDIAGHLDGTPHGAPIATELWTLGASHNSGGLPEQTAVVLSFHGSYIGLMEQAAADSAIPTDDRAQDEGAPATHLGRARPRARHRGRVYIGPLDAASIVEGAASSHMVITTNLRTDGCNAMQNLRDNVESRGTPSYWAVWSRRDATLTRVIGGHVDDRIDSQRRRTQAATARTTWGV